MLNALALNTPLFARVRARHARGCARYDTNQMIRILGPDDALAFWQLRLQALEQAPPSLRRIGGPNIGLRLSKR